MNGFVKPKQAGFTIVELIIVIVVIAILATISVIAYDGIQKRASNVMKYDELMAWQELFELYVAKHGRLPVMPTDKDFCLGTGYPNGYSGVPRCHQYLYNNYDISPLESDNASIMADLKTVGKLPHGPREPIGVIVGPYGAYDGYNVRLTMIIYGTKEDCPHKTTPRYTSTSSGYGTCSVDIGLST